MQSPNYAAFPIESQPPITSVIESSNPPLNQKPSIFSAHKPGNLASLMTFEKTLDLYRQNARKSTIPHIQMEFAKYLIEIGTTLDTSNDEVSTLKARQTLVDEGIGWIKRLATQGFGFGKPAYAEAQFFLGECYGSSLLGVEVDHERAFALFVQSSKQNHPAASYYAAVYYEMGVGTRKDYPRAVQFYRKAAALGHSGAMLKLALTLLNGTLNVVRNEREAVTWLKRAANVADENHPDAIHELALVYEKDNVQSVIMDEGYARELFTKAAQLGFSPSQYKLGKSYEYGQLTCEVDARRSVSWYTRAAEQGHSDAELALSGWYLTGSEGVLEQNDTEAYLWARKAAEKGFANAEYAIGYYTEVGIGVAPDINEAIGWYMKAAAQDNERAKERLTEIKRFKKAHSKQKADRSKEHSECCLM